MSSVFRLLVMGITMASFWQPASSIQVANQARSNNASVVTTNTVERGGTVDAVNIKKNTIVVDGHSYSLAAAPLVVHSTPGKGNQGLEWIRPGMKIRFNTTKNNYSGQDQVVEIWISDVGKASTKK